MARPRSYSDDALAAAVARATSWRGVLRGLGLSATSSSSIASVRRAASSLDLDVEHLTGQRLRPDDDLRSAVADSSTWTEVADLLGLAPGSQRTLRTRALRLGLDISHLGRRATASDPRVAGPSVEHLAPAGALLAAAWFTLTGAGVSWPLEPRRYDLLVDRDGVVRRVQVKTATRRAGTSWVVWISTTGRGRRPDDPSEVDDFFVVDGQLGLFLIPLADVVGRQAVHLSAYERFRLPGLGDLSPAPEQQ